jgi:2-methylaconitate cis-trans-isomerase PrpF
VTPNTTLSIQNGVVNFDKYAGTLRSMYNASKEEYADKRAQLMKTVRRLFPG